MRTISSYFYNANLEKTLTRDVIHECYIDVYSEPLTPAVTEHDVNQQSVIILQQKKLLMFYT